MNCFSLKSGKDKQVETFSASSHQIMVNWIKAFRGVKEMYSKEKQLEIDKLKSDLNKKTVKKERVSIIFQSKINAGILNSSNMTISEEDGVSGNTFDNASSHSAGPSSPSKFKVGMKDV